jgi:Formyl transferase
MKTLLICHDGARLTQLGIARWMGSFSELTGIIVLRETKGRMRRRIRREFRRVGLLRFIDVLAFRLYYRLFLSSRDEKWEREALDDLCNRYAPLADGIPVLITHSPNTRQAEEFIRTLRPDIMIARCKTLLSQNIFSIPTKGTFVFHPGICPEYRNAHGCFWALANDDIGKVGMTLVRIDEGVDTGPVYGYYSYDYDEVNESHIIIMHRVVLDNLNELRERLLEVWQGSASPIKTSGRTSAMWGQPWLSKYVAWKRKAKRRARESNLASVS